VVEFDAVGKYVFQKAFMDAKEQYKQRVADGTISDKGWHIVMINNLRQATAKAKAIYAVKLAKKAVDNGHQVIVFTNFKQSSNYIERWLDDYGANAVLLNGSVSKKGRQLLVDEFQSGNSKVFVMTRAGTDGLNLQKGSIAISVDRTWSPFDMLQWEGRIHRNGQENPCFSIWLQDGIIDPYIDNKMMEKYRTVRQILHGTVDDLDGVSSPRDWAERLSNWLFRDK
jgi:superfamily II DNA or RNA helicase